LAPAVDAREEPALDEATPSSFAPPARNACTFGIIEMLLDAVYSDCKLHDSAATRFCRPQENALNAVPNDTQPQSVTTQRSYSPQASALHQRIFNNRRFRLLKPASILPASDAAAISPDRKFLIFTATHHIFGTDVPVASPRLWVASAHA
jgi:hypothetical protein